MAQGGALGFEKLKNLAHMQIIYTGKRRERNPQRISLTEREMIMQENVFKSAFAIPHDKMDLSYPTSIQNITLNLEKFETENITCNAVKDYNLGYTYIYSAITSEILEHDLKVFPNSEEIDYEEHGAVGGADYFRNIQRSATPRPLSRLAGKNAKLYIVPYSTTAEEYFGEPKNACRSLLSLRVKGEPAPINILIGEDDILKDGLVDEPPTIKHTHGNEDLIAYLHLFEQIKPSKELRECEERNHLFYYWYHDIIKAGCVYWMVTDKEKYTLHDLTSTFNMEPYRSSSTVVLDEVEINAIKNANGLLYYNSLQYRWQNEKITPALRSKAFELSERANKLINKEQFPIKWSLANVIYSDILIPQDVDLNETSLYLCTKKQGPKEYTLRRVVLSLDVYNAMKEVLVNSLNHLRRVLEFLVKRKSKSGAFPLMNSTLPKGINRLEFDLDTLAKGLVKIEVRNIRGGSVMEVLNSFVEDNDLEMRVVAYVIRKIFLDCVTQARIFQRYEQFANMTMFAETAIAAWIGLTSVLSEERMPLPLRPLFMLGDAFYRLSNHKETAKELLKNYVVSTEKVIIKNLEMITSVYDDERTLKLIKRDQQHFYMRDSFECYARAILYSELVPDEDVIMRICIVANDLIFAYLEISDENNDKYIGESNAKRSLMSCKLLLDVVFKLVVQFTSERKILASAYGLKARYMRICIHQELKEGKKVDDDICNEFVKIFTLLNKAFSDFEPFNIEIPTGKNLITMEFTVALTDYIFRLRYREDQDKVSFHKDIIPSYARYLELCRSRSEVVTHGPYFKFRAAVGYASLAEYLFGLYKEKKNDKIKNQAESWFEVADTSFRQLQRYSGMELIKTRNDRLAFYDFMAAGQGNVTEYDSKTITILLESFNLLVSIPETEYAQTSRDVLTNNRRIRMRGVLKALEKRLQNAMHRRTSYYITNNATIDIPSDKIRNLYQRSLNAHQVDLLENLKSVLREIKTLKDQDFRG